MRMRSSWGTRGLAARTGVAAAEPLEGRTLLAADLVAVSADADNQAVQPGDDVDVTVMYQNAGNARAGAFRIQTILTRDRVIGNDDDVLLGNFRRLLGVNAGQTVTTSRSFTIPDDTPSGAYFVATRLDTGGVIPEGNENNNTVISDTRAIVVGDAGGGIDYEVRGRNDELIEDNDSTPSGTDGTAFGQLRVDNASRTRTFTIVNNGSEDLNVEDITVTGPAAADYEIVNQPEDSIAPGDTATFMVRFNPTAAGQRTAVITITPGNTGDDDGYSFTVTGRGTQPSGIPDISVSARSAIGDGDTTPSTAEGTSFGQVTVGTFAEQVYTITNSGTGTLNLTSPFVTITGRNANRFTVVEGPSDTSLAPGQSTRFRVRFDPGSNGDKRATISIFSNDPDEGPFTFLIRGIGHPR